MADGGMAPPPGASRSAEPPADASMSAEPPDDAGTSAEPPSSDCGDADPFGSDATMPLQPEPLLGIAGPFNGRIFAFGVFGLMLQSTDQGQNWTRVTDATLGVHPLTATVRAAQLG